MAEAGSERKVALAAVAGAHGIKGELRLKLFSESAESLSRQETLYIGGVERSLLSIRQTGSTAVAKLDGIADRAGAEELRGSLVEVRRSSLPPLDDGEYYHVDLIGLDARDPQGNPVGTVVAVENYGAGDLLEIQGLDGRRRLIPFKSGIADLHEGFMVVDLAFLA
ncbi:MAG TPA: ribosome maturation factor RimM [Sphingomicrobium sp.]|nr:ribosome maturation factor RimM [Sphingomicrobium sp.]